MEAIRRRPLTRKPDRMAGEAAGVYRVLLRRQWRVLPWPVLHGDGEEMEDIHFQPSFNEIAVGRPRTFGAALDRARKALAFEIDPDLYKEAQKAAA